MYWKTFIVLAVVSVIMVLTNAQKDSNDVISIRDIDQRLNLALSRSNAVVLDQIVAEGYVEINTQGQMSGKGEVLTAARARKSAPAGIEVGPERTLNEQTVRVHGNTAVLVHLISIKHLAMDYQTSGPPPAQALELIDQEMQIRVYSRSGSTWRLVAQQTTFIPKR